MAGSAPNGAFTRIATIVTAIAATLGVLASLIAFFVKIANLEYTNASLLAHMDRLEAAQDVIANRTRETQATVGKMERDLQEVETQFCGEDNLRNLNRATDLRMFALLWRKVFDQEYPTANAFYPRIGRCVGMQ